MPCPNRFGDKASLEAYVNRGVESGTSIAPFAENCVSEIPDFKIFRRSIPISLKMCSLILNLNLLSR